MWLTLLPNSLGPLQIFACLILAKARESKRPNKRGNEYPERTSDLPKIMQLESDSQDSHPGSQVPGPKLLITMLVYFNSTLFQHNEVT